MGTFRTYQLGIIRNGMILKRQALHEKVGRGQAAGSAHIRHPSFYLPIPPRSVIFGWFYTKLECL